LVSEEASDIFKGWLFLELTSNVLGDASAKGEAIRRLLTEVGVIEKEVLGCWVVTRDGAARVGCRKGGFDLWAKISRKGTSVGVEKAGLRILNAGVPVGLLTLFLPESRISISAAINVSGSAMTRRGWIDASSSNGSISVSSSVAHEVSAGPCRVA